MQDRFLKRINTYLSIIIAGVAIIGIQGRRQEQRELAEPIVRSKSVVSAVSTFKDCTHCPEMVTVPAGRFLMGASPDDMASELAAAGLLRRAAMESLKDEAKPQHLVTISRRFAIGRYDVTRQEYAEFVHATNYSGGGGCKVMEGGKYRQNPHASWEDPGFAQTDDDPVVCVSRKDAESYIKWLNSVVDTAGAWNGLGPYRLPTEDEWEYSARAGTQTGRWWGDDIGNDNANCKDCGVQSRKGTRSSLIYPANKFGLGDVLGNVWQMVADCWHYGYVNAVSYNAVWTVPGCTQYVMRGGTWNNEAYVARSFARGQYSDNDPASFVGFRVVKEISQ